MAADGSYSGGPSECAGAGHPLWFHSQEEVGSELGLHGTVCICSRAHLLGHMGIPPLIWGQVHPLPRHPQLCPG